MARKVNQLQYVEFNKEEFDARMESLPWISTDSINIDRYFTKAELENLCDYEKLRLKNMKRNYETMQLLGFPIKKPEFMLSKRQQAKIRRQNEAALAKDEDVDWTPQLEREQDNHWNDEAPKPMIWKPPLIETKKTIPGSTVASSCSVRACYLDDSDGEEFEGYSDKEIKTAKRRCQKELKRCHRKLAKMETGDLVEDEEEETKETPKRKKQESQRVKGSIKEEKHHYPRRNIVRRDYTEMEVPDDDHYIFCDDCNREYEGDCPVHGPLVIIKDTEVKDVDLKSGTYRSHLSLPSGLVIKSSSIPKAGAGIWAEKPVPKAVRFGPYEGTIVEHSEDAHSGYCWQIYKAGHTHHFVDAVHKNHSNWMRYVNCACREEDQNLLAFQFHGQIYYRTIECVPANTELLVWYGDEYGRELGITRQDFVSKKQHSNSSNIYKCSSDDSDTACDICGRLFSRDVCMMKHRRYKHPLADINGHGRQGLYKCKLCLYSDDNVDSFQQHWAVHQRNQGRQLQDTRHQNVTDSHKARQPCVRNTSRWQKGDKRLTNDDQLTQVGGKPHKCDICGAQFTLSGHLKQHLRTHTGEKPYKCDICGAQFTLSGNLKVHLRTHTGEKPYKCDICGAQFTQSGPLKAHLQTHTGEKPYKCDICGAQFTLSGTLKVHLRTHTGEKPYKCDICGARFTRSGHLKRHQCHVHQGHREDIEV